MSTIDITKRIFCDNCDKTTIRDSRTCPAYSLEFGNGKKVCLCEECMVELYLSCKRVIDSEILGNLVKELE